MSASLGSGLVRRTLYVPSGPQERFVVPLLRRAIEDAIGRFARLGDARVLDVGCGRQPFRPLVESLGCGYVGVDVEQNPEGSVAVVCGIDGELPAELQAQAPFDFVLCTEVLEHVLDWGTAFANLRALAAERAHVFVTCPHVYPPHEEPRDYWRPTLHAIARHAEAAGFEIVEARRLGDAWDAVGTLLAAGRPQAAAAGVLPRVLARACRFACSKLTGLLAAPWFRSRVSMPGGVYLSNAVVLRAGRGGGA